MLTLLQELEPIAQIALVAHKQQTPVLLGPRRLPLARAHLGPVRDPAAQDAVRVDAFDDVLDVPARVHLADVRRERTLLLRAGGEGEVVARRERRVVPQRRQRHRRARVPAARQARAEERCGVDAGVADVGRVLGEEPRELGDELLQEAEGEEAAVEGPRGAGDRVARAAEQDHAVVFPVCQLFTLLQSRSKFSVKEEEEKTFCLPGFHWRHGRPFGALGDARHRRVGDAVLEAKVLVALLLARADVSGDLEDLVDRVVQRGEGLVEGVVDAAGGIARDQDDAVDGAPLELGQPGRVEGLRAVGAAAGPARVAQGLGVREHAISKALVARVARVDAELLEPPGREGNVGEGDGQVVGVFLGLVLGDVLAALSHGRVGRDQGHEGVQAGPERRDIVLDLEKVEGLGLLGEPGTNVTQTMGG